MTRQRLKLIVWMGFFFGLLLASWIALRLLGDLVTYFQQGADPAAALNIVPNQPVDWPVKVEWRPDDADTGREMEPFTREQLEAAYVRAWLQWTFSYQKGEPFGLKTYFSGPALTAVSDSVESAAASGFQLEQIGLEHDLQLHFYAADGSIVALTDHGARIVTMVYDAEGHPIDYTEEEAVYEVVMMLEDGTWRIRQWVRTDVVESKVAGVEFSAEPAGINYYPQETPWDLFWPNYDPETTQADLNIVKSLGLDSVRIFIPYQQFGEDEVSADYLSSVADFLDQADANDIGVIVTLFDFRWDYGLLTWPKADRHLEQLAQSLREKPALLAWDVKNEPDLDYGSQTKLLVNAWLAHSIKHLRSLDPDTPITIGWADAANAPTLANELDFVSFHYWGLAGDLPETVTLLAEKSGDKPIVMTEFGIPTWNSPFFPHGHTPIEQAEYIADVLDNLATTSTAGYLAWTLYDYDPIPNTVAGRWPWQKGPQGKMGVIDGDGDLKLSAEFLSPTADLSLAPSVPSYARFFKPFWLTVLGGMALCLLIAAVLFRRLRERLV